MSVSDPREAETSRTSWQGLLKSLHSLTRVACRLVTADGSVLASAGWKPALCRRFPVKSHNGTSCACEKNFASARRRCAHGLLRREFLTQSRTGETLRLQFGNVLTAPPTAKTLRETAKRHGFDETAYLETMRSVPVVEATQLKAAVHLAQQLVESISAGAATKNGNGLPSLNGALSPAMHTQSAETALERRLIIEHLISDISSTLLRTAPDVLDEQIEAVLERVRNVFEADAAHFFEIDTTNGKVLSIYEARGGDAIESVQFLKSEESSPFTYSKGVFGRGESLVVTDRSDLPPEAQAERELWERANVVAALVTPVATVRGMKGIFSLACARAHAWLADDSAVLRLIGDLLLYALQHRHDAEEAKRAHQRLRLAALSADFGIYDYDATTETFTLDPMTMTLFGFAPGEFDGTWQSLSTRLTSEVARAMRAALDAVVAGEGGIDGFEFPVLLPDNTERWILAYGARMADLDGPREKIVGVTLDITYRKRLEQSTLHREELYRLLTEGSRDMISQHTADTRILYVSPACRRLLGYEPEELVGVQGSSLVINEDFPKVLAKVRSRFGSGHNTYSAEMRMVRKDGSVVWVETLGRLRRDESGRLVEIVCSTRDISARKHTEAALRESELRYRLLAQHAIDVIWTCDLNLHFTYMSPSVVRLLGYTPEEALATAPQGTLTPRSIALVSKALAEELRIEAIRPGQSRPRTLEIEQIRKDGTIVWTEATASFMRDEQGKISGIVGVTRDITERREAEKALRASEERMRLVLEATSHGVWDANIETGDIYYSGSCVRMLGYAPQEMPHDPKHWWELLHSDDRARVEQALSQVIDGALQAFAIEFRLRNAEGAWQWVLSRGRVVSFGENGKPVRVVGTHTDISDRRRAEEALREAHDQLEARVQQRTAELARSNAVLWTEIAERRRAEAALRESESKNRALLKAIPDFILQVADDGTVLDYQGPSEPGGFATSTAIGHDLAGILGEAHTRAFMNTAHRVLSAGGIEVLNFQQDRAGEQRDYEARLVVSGAARVMAIIRDVTEQRRLEKQILAISAREERRIGQDLHDGLGQHLTGVAFLAKVLERKLSGREVPEHEEAAQIARLVSDAVSHTRALARGLHPLGLDAHGLMEGLETLASTTSRLFEIECRFHCPVAVLIEDENTSTHVFRIAQEAVHNAVRHGRAHLIDIHLTREDDLCRLEVVDNGVGFTPETKGKGMGLHIMDYRAKMLGGGVEVTSKPHEARTSIVCVFPHFGRETERRAP